MSEGKESNSVLDKISSGGKKKSDDVPSVAEQINRHEEQRREDWAFFTLYIFMLLDFVFFVIVKIWYLPAALCLFQLIALCSFICKKGWQQSWALVNRFLGRIVGTDRTKIEGGRKDDFAPFAITSEREDASEKLETLKKARKQDWFIFLVLNFIFLDVIFFSALNNWAAPVSLLILESFILFALGEKMGMTAICELINNLSGTMLKK